MELVSARSANSKKHDFNKFISDIDREIKNHGEWLGKKEKEDKENHVSLVALQLHGWTVTENLGLVGSNCPERLEQMRKRKTKNG